MERKASFNTAAQLYDEARPSYPDVAIDWILDRTNIESDDTLLEIGPGTGQATLKFAERGYRIRGVELGQNMADMLMQKVGNYKVTVDVGPFEKWQPRGVFPDSADLFGDRLPLDRRGCQVPARPTICSRMVATWPCCSIRRPILDKEEVKKAHQLLGEVPSREDG